MIANDMRRFLASAWFPLLISLTLAGITAAAFALLAPTGADVGNSEIVKWTGIAAWAAGPILGLLTFLLIGILNLIRRIVRLRKVAALHPVVVLAGVLPWLIFAWEVTGEPRFTPIARAVIDFIARPMLWGSLCAALLTIFLSIPLLFPAKR
jgi:hypothetical protein